MSNAVFFGKNSLRFLYYRYKDSSYYAFSIIALAMVVCLIIIFQFILPQLQDWFSIQNEIIATTERIAIIKNNISFMNNIDQTNLDKQVSVVSSALPAEKQFDSILNALSASALNAGISLENYSFQLGNIASTAGQLNDEGLKGVSTVKVTISLSGSIDGVGQFLKQIQHKLPLSEVLTLDGDKDSITLAMQFYQKQFPVLVLKDDVPVVQVSGKNNALIETLASWQPPTNIQDVPSGSSSAMPLF